MKDIEIYKQKSTPPKWALKEIGAGRLKGMTDIKPQWRIDALTEIYGLCGFGWYPEIVSQWIDIGANGEQVANTKINLYVKMDGEWSKPISAIGGSKFVSNEKNGAYTSDEAYKMSFTDAVSVACKQLGIAADIYRGCEHDSSKYETPAEKAQNTRAVNKEIKANDLDTRYNRWLKYWMGKEWTKAADDAFQAFLADAKEYDMQKMDDLLAIYSDKVPKVNDQMSAWA